MEKEKKYIMKVNEFLKDIKNVENIYEKPLDIITEPTMSLAIKQMNFFLEILDKCSEIAEYFLQLYDSPKWINEFSTRYEKFQKTTMWKIGRFVLRELCDDNLASHYFGTLHKKDWCYFCKEEIEDNKGVLHHLEYIKNNLFNPKYIAWAHYKCHKKYHKKEVNK